MGDGRCYQYCWKILCAGLADDSGCSHKILEELSDVLIVDIQRLLKSVQFRIVEYLPPLAAKHCIGRLSDGPSLALLKLGRRFLVSGRRLCRWRMILGPHGGGRQQQHQEQWRTECNAMSA